jgi:hypothetical protein
MELVLQDILNDAALKDALVEIKYENHPLTTPARIGKQRVVRILGDLSVESVSINYDINKMYGLSLEEILLHALGRGSKIKVHTVNRMTPKTLVTPDLVLSVLLNSKDVLDFKIQHSL